MTPSVGQRRAEFAHGRSASASMSRQPSNHRFEYTDWSRDDGFDVHFAGGGCSTPTSGTTNNLASTSLSAGSTWREVEPIRLGRRNPFSSSFRRLKLKGDRVNSSSPPSASSVRFYSIRKPGGSGSSDPRGSAVSNTSMKAGKGADKAAGGRSGHGRSAEGGDNSSRRPVYFLDADSEASMLSDGFYYSDGSGGGGGGGGAGRGYHGTSSPSSVLHQKTQYSPRVVGGGPGATATSDLAYHEQQSKLYLDPGRQDGSGSLNGSCDGGEKVPVTISGLPHVFSKRTHWARRIAWAIVLSVCFGITLAQCYERILHYLSMPVNVDVQIQRNQSLKFPTVTICNKNVFNITKLKALLAMPDETGVPWEQRFATNNSYLNLTFGDLIGFRNMTAEAIWGHTAHDRSEMVVECWFGRGTRCYERGTWRTVFTILGVCYTYELNGTVTTSGLFNNMYLKLREKLPLAKRDGEFGWKIHLQDAKDSSVLEIQSHGFTILPGWNKDIRLGIRDFQTLDTKQRPCDSSEEYSTTKCVARCFAEALLARVGCLLPFAAPFHAGPSCDTKTMYDVAENAAKKMFELGEWNPANCTCMRECDSTYFTPYGETVLSADNATARMRIYYQEMTYDDVSEDLAYTEIPLLCDIGGALGLMLGASVLTFVEVLESFWAAVMRLGKPQTAGRVSKMSQHKLYRGT